MSDARQVLLDNLDDIDRVIVPLMEYFTTTWLDGIITEHRGVAGIIMRCNGRQFHIDCDTMSALINERFFELRNIPVVISTDLHELNMASRSTPAHPEDLSS